MADDVETIREALRERLAARLWTGDSPSILMPPARAEEDALDRLVAKNAQALSEIDHALTLIASAFGETTRVNLTLEGIKYDLERARAALASDQNLPD